MKLDMSNNITISLEIGVKLVHDLVLLIEEHLNRGDLGFLIKAGFVAMALIGLAVIGESDLG